jgi:hypothetical protein
MVSQECQETLDIKAIEETMVSQAFQVFQEIKVHQASPDYQGSKETKVNQVYRDLRLKDRKVTKVNQEYRDYQV